MPCLRSEHYQNRRFNDPVKWCGPIEMIDIVTACWFRCWWFGNVCASLASHFLLPPLNKSFFFHLATFFPFFFFFHSILSDSDKKIKNTAASRFYFVIMDQLLDFSKDIDVDLLDRIVSVFFSAQGSPAEVCWLLNPIFNSR